MSSSVRVACAFGLVLALGAGEVRADSEASSSGKRISLGLDVGASVPGMTDFYSYGIGKAFVVSGQFGTWRIDWRFAESYDLRQSSDLGARVEGTMTSHSLGLAKVFRGPLRPALSVGAARVSTSVATVGESGFVVPAQRNGLGLVLGVEAGHTIAPNIEFLVGARAYVVQWEEVSGQVIYEADEESFTAGVEPEAGVPVSMSLGLRVFWE